MSLRSLLLSTCLGACLAGHEAQAQATSGTLRGTVTDDRNARPLPAAEVELLAPDTTIRAATDADGHFRMDAVPVGIHRPGRALSCRKPTTLCTPARATVSITTLARVPPPMIRMSMLVKIGRARVLAAFSAQSPPGVDGR